MRNVILVALFVPVLALAVPNLTPMTIIDTDEGRPQSQPVVRVDGQEPQGEPYVLIGTVDTVGGTTYDWQVNGPSRRCLSHSADNGLHVGWMYSASDQTEFPDRNLRYNYFDYAEGAWNWVEPGDHMQSGVNVYTERCGYGNVDADPATGVAVFSAHLGTPLRPDIARDMAPGAGLFEYCSGDPTMVGYLWPYISVGQSGAIHTVCNDDASRNMIFYSKVDPWCTWADPVGLAAPQPDPDFPNQNIAASKVSDKVCATWVLSLDGATEPAPGFYRISTDAGATWAAAEELPWPSAFGGDTATSYYVTSLFPYYDQNDDLHIVTDVSPYLDGQGRFIPAQLWHWSPDNTPNWSHIYTATCDLANLQAVVGSNALYACRMSMGEDSEGKFYVTWEQFDSSNVETGPPEVLRADIFAAASGDNGVTWGDPVKLTEGGAGTRRFPTIVDIMPDMGAYEEKLAVRYIIDEIAGFFVQSENIATNNPVIVQWVSTLEIGIAEPGQGTVPNRIEMAARPNPFGNRTQIAYALPRATDVSLVVYDAAGRPIRTLVDARCEAGRHTATWDGRADNGDRVAAGIYFYTLTTDFASQTQKLTVVR